MLNQGNRINHFRGEYGWLSNMSPAYIEYKGLWYQSTERAYQSAKNDDINWKFTCASYCYGEGDIKKLSKLIKDNPNWNNIKLGVMRECLILKFSIPHLREKLLATKGKYIEEGNYWNDTYWGVDLKQNPPVGENHLGLLLMDIRDNILSSNSSLF